MVGIFKAISNDDIERIFDSILDEGARPTVRELCSRLGYSQYNFSRSFPLRFGEKYTEWSQRRFFERIEKMKSNGKNLSDIAAEFELTPTAISLAISRYMKKGK